MILRTETQGDLDSYLEHLNTVPVQEHLGGVKEPHEIEASMALALWRCSKRKMARCWAIAG